MGTLSAAEELVLQLTGVEDEDRMLPLQVLINMNRRALRAPLERLSAVPTSELLPAAKMPTSWSDEEAQGQAAAINDWVGECWQSIDDGKILRDSFPLATLSSEIHDDSGWTSLGDEGLLRTAGSPSILVGALILQASDSWTAYDPLYGLHQLTWAGANTRAILELIDLELELDPAFLQLIERFSRS